MSTITQSPQAHSGRHTQHKSERPTEHEVTISLRSVLAGLAIGTMVCFANLYFGLQSGLVNSMTLPSALLGFASFKSVSRYLDRPFTPMENVIIQTISTSLGGMPVTAGFNGVIPALEYLTTSKENGPLKFSLPQLIVWSLGTCLLGITIASCLKYHLIIRSPMRFPTGTASAVLIGFMHGREEILDNVKKDQRKPLEKEDTASTPSEQAIVSRPRIPGERESSDTTGDCTPSRQVSDWQLKAPILAFGVSGGYTLLSYFVPAIQHLPLFGAKAASWAWSISPSPAYVGYGMIMKPSTTAYMLVGAILGWGVLSPLAQHRGWAPGPISDWQNGSQGWLLWVGLGAILGDSAVGILWVIIHPTLPTLRFGLKDVRMRVLDLFRSSNMEDTSSLASTDNEAPDLQDSHETTPLLTNHNATIKAVQHYESLDETLSPAAMGLWFFGAAILCILTTIYLFGGLLSVSELVISVLLVIPLALGSIRAMGETDNSLASSLSKVSQFVFSLIIPGTNPNAVITSLLIGAISEAGVFQSSDVIEHFKTGYLVGASPKALFYGQAIGSVAGAIIGSVVYKLYTVVYTIPSEQFPVPAGQLWLATAKLVYGGGLPDGAWIFALFAFVLSAIFAIIGISAKNLPWVNKLPNGIAVGVGLYVLPSYTIPIAFGGLAHYCAIRYAHAGETSIITISSGFVLGQGVFNVVSVILGLLHVPQG